MEAGHAQDVIEIAKIGGPALVIALAALWLMWRITDRVLRSVIPALKELTTAITALRVAVAGKLGDMRNKNLGVLLLLPLLCLFPSCGAMSPQLVDNVLTGVQALTAATSTAVHTFESQTGKQSETLERIARLAEATNTSTATVAAAVKAAPPRPDGSVDWEAVFGLLAAGGLGLAQLRRTASSQAQHDEHYEARADQEARLRVLESKAAA